MLTLAHHTFLIINASICYMVLLHLLTQYKRLRAKLKLLKG